MRLKLCLAAGTAVLLLAAYFLVSHAFVLVRLASAIMFAVVAAVLAIAVLFLGRLR